MAATSAFGRLCLIGFTAHLSYALARFPVVPLFARSLGLSETMIGMVVGASTSTGVLLKLPAGRMSDLLGRRPLLIVSACAFALPPFFYPLVTAGLALLALRMVHGLATATFGPVSSAIVSDIAEPARRGERLSTFSSATLVGKSLGPLLGAYLIFGENYSWPFLASGVIGLVALAAALSWKHETFVAPPRGAVRKGEFLAGIREVTGHFGIMAVSAVEAMQFVATGAMDAFLPIYATASVGLPARMTGWLYAAQISTTLLAKPLLGRLSDRIGRRPQIVAGLLVAGVAIALVGAAKGFVALLAVSALYGFGVAVTTSSTAALVTDLAPRERYGAAHGVFGTIMDIGHAAGPVATGLLASALGVGQAMPIVGGVLVISAGIFAVIPLGRSYSGATR